MKNKKEKIAVFGGSFDPPHFAHIDIVKNLEARFDRVMVMPSYLSPFKESSEDAKLRYKLCKSVFSSERTEVSRYEISKKHVVYSVDTARRLAEKTRAKLYWVIGSEELLRLPEWKEIDKLKKLVTFYAVPRPDFIPNESVLDGLKKRRIKIKFAPFGGLPLSSTDIKIDYAFDRPVGAVPSAVSSAAKKFGAFDPYKKYVMALYAHGLSKHRIDHTFGVAKRGAFLAKLYGANVNDTVIACLLHDIAKSVDAEKYDGRYDKALFPEPLAHAPIGADIAEKEFGVSPEIAHAIYTHGTASDDMSLIGEIVYLADKTEEGRSYDSVYYLRYLCTLDRDIAMYVTIKLVREWAAKKSGARDTTLALAAQAKYAQRIEGRSYPAFEEYESASAAARKKAGKEYMNDRNKSTDKRTVKITLGKAEDAESEQSDNGVFAPDADSISAPDPKSSPAPNDGAAAPYTTVAEAKKKRYPDALGEIEDIAFTAANELSLHKAHDVDIVDLAGKTVIADYFVIASVTSYTAVKALTGYVEDKLTKTFGINPNKRDSDREWVALDYGNVIIHIFTDKMRAFYDIERLWADGKNVTRIGE